MLENTKLQHFVGKKFRGGQPGRVKGGKQKKKLRPETANCDSKEWVVFCLKWGDTRGEKRFFSQKAQQRTPGRPQHTGPFSQRLREKGGIRVDWEDLKQDIQKVTAQNERFRPGKGGCWIREAEIMGDGKKNPGRSCTGGRRRTGQTSPLVPSSGTKTT